MKSIIRAAIILSVVLTPAFAFAQQQSQVMFSQTVPQTNVVVSQQNTGGSYGWFFSTGGGPLGGCASSLCGIASTILYIINSILVPIIFAFAFIVFLWGIYKAYIYSAGDPVEVEKGHKLIFWGLIAFAVMISVWGLVNVVTNTFGLAGTYGPMTLPRSY